MLILVIIGSESVVILYDLIDGLLLLPFQNFEDIFHLQLND